MANTKVTSVEPEPNKYTLAFNSSSTPSDSAALHLELLNVPWSVALLAKPGCSEERDPETGAVIWRGLHARCGVIYGLGPTRKPLNTGRADYFGAIPNLAARVCATAQYGQTLIEPTMLLSGAMWDAEEVHGFLPEGPTGAIGEKAAAVSNITDTVMAEGPGVSLKMLGSFTLKGVSAWCWRRRYRTLAAARSSSFETPWDWRNRRRRCRVRVHRGA